jgi:hypothetical protein
VRKAAPLAGYLLISFLYFGIRVVAHPGRDFIGVGTDPEIFIWSFAWWPHAILHGENPFVSHVVWAPDGVNLTWVTSTPGLAVLLAPVTLIFGPVVSYNLASLAAPALAAFTAYLLCRRLTGALWPSVTAGYLFGFSSYVLGQEQGHLHVSTVFLLPLIALVLIRFFAGEYTGRDLSWRLGLLLVAQLSISIEVAFTASIAIGVGLLLCPLIVPRGKVWRAIGAIGAAFGIAAVLAAPFLAFLISGFHHGSFNLPQGWNGDAANFLIPTQLTLIGTTWSAWMASHFTGNNFERGAYLGAPVCVIVVWFAIAFRRLAATRFLVAALVLAVIATLGTSLTWRGSASITLPWSALVGLPGFDNALPTRLSVYVALVSAVIVSLWLSSARIPRWLRISLGTLAVIAILPHATDNLWYTHPAQPAFFADKLTSRCIAPGENIMILPYTSNGDSMLWQAESDFRFRMAGGHVAPNPPPEFERFPAVASIDENGPPPHGAADLRAFARAKGVSVIVVDAPVNSMWASILLPLASPVAYEGVYVYRLSGHTPSSCTSTA